MLRGLFEQRVTLFFITINLLVLSAGVVPGLALFGLLAGIVALVLGADDSGSGRDRLIAIGHSLRAVPKGLRAVLAGSRALLHPARPWRAFQEKS